MEAMNHRWTDEGGIAQLEESVMPCKTFDGWASSRVPVLSRAVSSTHFRQSSSTSIPSFAAAALAKTKIRRSFSVKIAAFAPSWLILVATSFANFLASSKVLRRRV
jgi:hypothetical protein